MGVGSAAVAAVRTGRHYLGYDTDAGYVDVARRRAADELRRVLSASGPPEPAGDKAVTVAASLLHDAGFAVDERVRRKVGGVDVALLATDRAGREWLVEVVGGFTVGRPGLRHGDVLERTLGRAVRLSGFGARPLLLLATDMPARRSAGAAALAEARGRAFLDVLPIEAAAVTVERLGRYARATSPPQPIGELLVPD
jgi:hypothetical protein